MQKKLFTLSLAMILCLAMKAEEVKQDSTTSERSYTIGEVVVTGTRNKTDIRHLPMTISVIGPKEIESANRPSLLPTLSEQVPGLFITGRGMMGYGVATGASGGMTMRGIGAGTQGTPTTGMLVLIDGHPQYMGLMGHPIADAYQTMLADRVEVLRGPASVLYGSSAMGGVINIVTRKAQEDGVLTHANVGYGSFNTVQAEASNRVKAGRFTSLVSLSYNRTDGHRKDMEFDQYGGFLKLGYEISNNWNIWADANITHFNAENPGPTTAPLIDNDSHITRGMTTLVVENEYEHTSGSLSFFYNFGRHNIDNGYAPGSEPLTYLFNSQDFMMGVSWFQSATFVKGNRITLGVDYQHFGGKAWNQFNETGRVAMIADKAQNEIAGYIDFRQMFGHWATLDIGVRLDHLFDVGTEWVPQGGLTFYVGKSAEIKATVGKGFRFPTIREMYMFPPQNPNLKAERLMNYELSFSQRLLDNSLSYGITLFYINGTDIITTEIVDSRPKYVNLAKVENCGVELEFAYRINKAWQVMANYSYLHLKYPVIAAPEHKAYAGVYFNMQRWDASTGFQFVDGLYTSTKPLVKERGFVLWNANVRFRATKWLHLFVRGENLLAQNYQINAGYPMPRATVLGGFTLNFNTKKQ